MKYISTRKNNESVDFKTAVFNGLTKNGGLYIPENIPLLADSFFENLANYSREEMAFEVLFPFVSDNIEADALKQIIRETINFEIPTVHVHDNQWALELYHGPTQAFKDVGARFMSRCLGYFNQNSQQKVSILAATSGDTGSAVAQGFYQVEGTQVKVLFPKGKVSPYQEYQMTSLGHNIQAIEVDGTFDDCQALVKQAFKDEDLNQKMNLSSANSINVARLLPQMLYYFFAYQAIQPQLNGKKLVLSVPSGNLGNITAGLIAKKMGLPIHRFISALNENDTFLQYLQSGQYQEKASVETYSNAMDVGAPSNFERIFSLYEKSVENIRMDISAFSYSNTDTLKAIKETYDTYNYLCDPHGVVAKMGLNEDLKSDEMGIFVETAAPVKFASVIQKVLPNFNAPQVDLSSCHKTSLANDFKTFKNLLLEEK